MFIDRVLLMKIVPSASKLFTETAGVICTCIQAWIENWYFWCVNEFLNLDNDFKKYL